MAVTAHCNVKVTMPPLGSAGIASPACNPAGVTLAGAGHCVPAVPEAAHVAVPGGTAVALQSSPGTVVQSSLTTALSAAEGPLLVTTMQSNCA